MNFTLMNRDSLHSKLSEAPEYEIQGDVKKCINIDFHYPAVMWPFFGQIRVEISAPDTPDCRKISQEAVTILVKLHVYSVDKVTSHLKQKSTITPFKIIFDFVATPDRSKRILFDQFHSLKYPQNGFIFKDNLGGLDRDSAFDNTLYEWHGDHLFTNY